MKIDETKVTRLDVPDQLPDLRRDLHVFVEYVRGRDVKRSHRGNNLSKGDSKRLAKLLSDSEALEEVQEDGTSWWAAFVDEIALKLEFVNYDTKGEYAGYTSSEPSFPDNYIEFQEKPYERFLAARVSKQEAALLKLLIERNISSNSEFFNASVVGRLDRFNSFGSATGVMPSLNFPAIRRFLLQLLAECPTGCWLSTASLVQHLREQHPYFLIPKKPKFKDEWNRRQGRYGNFNESKDHWGHDIVIKDTDEDAFERVEGRYVERFLEGIPLLLKYVDVAYSQRGTKAIYPSIGRLKAFRVSDRLHRALSGKIPEPQVTVTPNFDVHVQAETYPASVLHKLAPVCDLVSEGTSVVLQLKKQLVAGARAADPDLDVVTLLQNLAGAELPGNVARELSAWTQHGEKFVLYADCSLLEAEKDQKAAEPFVVERIAPGLQLVRSPNKLYRALEQQEFIPIRVKHGDYAFSQLPKGAKTRFSTKSPIKAKPRAAKMPAKLMRVTRVELLCPDREFLDRLYELLLAAQCPVQSDPKNLTLTYSNQHASSVSAAIRALGKDYKIKIEDVG